MAMSLDAAHSNHVSEREILFNAGLDLFRARSKKALTPLGAGAAYFQPVDGIVSSITGLLVTAIGQFFGKCLQQLDDKTIEISKRIAASRDVNLLPAPDVALKAPAIAKRRLRLNKLLSTFVCFGEDRP